MKKVLVNISWKMRKTHTRINLFDLYINDSWEGWGFDILNIRYNGKCIHYLNYYYFYQMEQNGILYM